MFYVYDIHWTDTSGIRYLDFTLGWFRVGPLLIFQIRHFLVILATVVTFGRPFKKRFALSSRIVVCLSVCPVLSCL